MIEVMNKKATNDIPLGIYKFYWVSGGSSVGVVAQDARGVRYFHCANWTVIPDGPMTILDKWEAGIIKMEKIECE